MAYEIQGFSYTLEASADLSASQYLAVVVDANGQAAISGAAIQIDGVLQNKPEFLGDTATIMQKGITKGVVGTAGVTAGDEVEIEAGGDFITLAAGVSVGKALVTGVADDIVPILLY